MKFYIQQWAVDEVMLEKWLQSAMYWWEKMDEVVENVGTGMNPPMVGDHRTKYGLCEMYDACFTLPREGWHQQYAQIVRAVEGVI